MVGLPLLSSRSILKVRQLPQAPPPHQLMGNIGAVSLLAHKLQLLDGRHTRSPSPLSGCSLHMQVPADRHVLPWAPPAAALLPDYVTRYLRLRNYD